MTKITWEVDIRTAGTSSLPQQTALAIMPEWWLQDIAGTLFKGEVYVPLLLEDEDGTAHGNDWARGFMRGMGMRHDGWAEIGRAHV